MSTSLEGTASPRADTDAAVTEPGHLVARVAARSRPRRRWRPHRETIAGLAVGAVIASALSASAWFAHDRNEARLLRQRVREAAALVSVASGSIQSPLASAAELVEATDADATRFRRLMGPLTKGSPFVSASVWRIGSAPSRPVAVVGSPPRLAAQSAPSIARALARARRTDRVSVVGLLDGARPRVAYAFTSPTRPANYVVWAESALPPDRTAVPQRDEAFADVDYALYLGARAESRSLLAASTAALPLRGRTASTTVAFGDTSLYLVIAARTPLGGGLIAALWWIIALAALVLMSAGTLLVERALRQRERAENLSGQLAVAAADNARLYADQRSVAHAIQQSLLPDDLPALPGIDLAVRYVPGVVGVDIGGDWYDVMPLGDDHALFVVGDVSGRGVRAGTIMASLRYSIRAYAMQGDPPAVIFAKLADLLRLRRDGHFATVLCGTIGLADRSITVANAGHPQPLVVHDGRADYLATPVGPPIGVRAAVPHDQTTWTLGPGTMLLAFTDGLVERRGEGLDVGLERLRAAVLAADGSLDEIVGTVVDALLPEHPHDDTAALGLRWHT